MLRQLGAPFASFGLPIPAVRGTTYEDYCGMAGFDRKRSFARNEELREVDSSRCPVVSLVSIFRTFTSLELDVLVIRSITANKQSGVLHVGPTVGRIDEVVLADKVSFLPSFRAS